MKRFLLAASLGLFAVHYPVQAAPDEEALGKALGYPVGTVKNYWFDDAVRVGSSSNMDKLFNTRIVEKAALPQELRQGRLDPAFRYRLPDFSAGLKLGEQTYSIDDYLQRQRVTGLMIVKDGEILLERYQYDRQPTHRLISNSIAKSITSLAVGCALEEGKIQSLDDKVSKYVKEMAGHPYGETSIRNLLRMASGVRFSENYDGADDFSRFLALRWEKGNIAALQAFGEREAPQGSRFHYATSETYLLGALVTAVTGKSLSDYVSEKIWKPMGAESDAKWIVDANGVEFAGTSFNAVLRDYARLGMLLANDGVRDGVQILPRAYLLEATDWHRQPEAFHPGRATPVLGYGYQFWLQPGEKRRFSLIGTNGQAIFVDPATKLVLVQTAVAKNADVYGRETMGQELAGIWIALLRAYDKP